MSLIKVSFDTGQTVSTLAPPDPVTALDPMRARMANTRDDTQSTLQPLVYAATLGLRTLKDGIPLKDVILDPSSVPRDRTYSTVYRVTVSD